MYQPELETLPREQLRKLQTQRLQTTIQRLFDRVPFYRQRLETCGIRGGDPVSLETLQVIPQTVKSDLRDHYPFGLLAEPMERIARIHASSGTTGKPTVVAYSAADLGVFAEVCARSLAAAGARPGMMLHNAYGYGLFTGGLGLHAGAETLRLNVVPVSGGMTERQLMLLQDFRPEIISCTPSYALTLAEALYQKGIDPASLNLRYALLGAEPWTERIRAEVEKGLGVTATNIYGLSEIIGPGVAQESAEEQHTGSYIWEDHFYPEVVDPETGKALPDGQPGVLLISTLSKEAMPLLRYRTGDITWLRRVHSGKRTHAKIGPILGRADDMLIVRGVNLFPSQVEAVLEDFPELSPHYRLILRREKTLDSICVQVEGHSDTALRQPASLSGPDPNRAEKALRPEQPVERLKRVLRDRTGLSMQVEMLSPGALPRSEGGKSGHVDDRRQLT